MESKVASPSIAGSSRISGCARPPEQPIDGTLFAAPSPRNVKPMEGLRFGRLVVLKYAGASRHRHARWYCKCDCGTIKIVLAAGLRNHTTLSCGCLQRELIGARTRKPSLSGAVFGRLLVKDEVPALEKSTGARRWNCVCQCGTELTVLQHSLVRGHTNSCGCLQRELTGERARGVSGPAHPSWNPKLTEADRARRRRASSEGIKFSLLARHARKRDRNTCYACGTSHCKLVVHHLEPWARDKNNRYKLANLITLCEPCHIQFHKLYGLDAGLEEFTEYLKE